jgi:hypothetical protein
MKRLTIRGHHLYCLRYLTFDPNERGQKFALEYTRIRNILTEDSGTYLDITIGPDELCECCPLCREEGCASSEGSEPEVRKLDHIILKSIGLTPESISTAGQLKEHLRLQSPITFCKGCQWYKTSVCRPPIDVEMSNKDLV